MADTIRGAECFYDALDISGEAVAFSAVPGGQVHESRPCNATMVRKNGGHRNYSGAASGVLSSTDPAQTMFDDAQTGLPFSYFFGIGTFGAQAAEDDMALFGQPIMNNLQWGNMNGDLASWALTLQFEALVLGFVGARGTKTSSSTGTGHQFAGGIADGQTLYAVMHVPTATSGTLDMIVESDDNSGFTSATTRITFTQVTTTATAQLLTWTPAGGSAEDWYRFSWTSASTPSHAIACAYGIL